MKAVFLTIAPVLLSATLSGQSVFSNNTQAVLETVIRDYPNHFYHIKGALIGQALQTSRYKSTIQLPGSGSGIVFVTSSAAGSGWVCPVMETDSFEKAKGRFADIYSQLSNSIITTSDQQTYILSGQYESPSEDKKSVRVIFSLLPGVGDMKKLKVELFLHEEEKEWKISLSVLDGDPKGPAQSIVTAN